MATFALGTAAGDLTAATLGLGYFFSGILFLILIALVAIMHFMAKISLKIEHRHQSRNAVLAFWLAYILTRPLGASFADWIGKSLAIGGLGIGDGTVAAAAALVIIALVWWVSYARMKTART
jgi:uncharacterized membrane-anchored protein